MTITLKPVDKDNFSPIAGLELAEDQLSFVASNTRSIAQAYVNYPHSHPYGIYADDTPVGFAMYTYDVEEDQHWVHRLMVDKDHQNKGYGTAGIRLLMEIIKEQDNYNGEILISFKPDNIGAEHVYEKLGFEHTDKMHYDEVLMRYRD